MKVSRIPYAETGEFTKLIADYLSGEDSLSPFYKYKPGIEAIPQVKVDEAPLKYEQAKLADGKALYGELCAVCHGTGAKGDGPAAPAIEMPVPDLTVLGATNNGVFPQDEEVAEAWQE